MIKDTNTIQQLLHTFYRVAESESNLIKTKVQSENSLQFELKEKALSSMQDSTSDASSVLGSLMMSTDSSKSTQKQAKTDARFGSYGKYMPGFQMIRTHLIKPLLFATEKVFEQYVPKKPQEDAVMAEVD